MLIDIEMIRFVRRHCEPDGGEMKNGGKTLRFIDFENTSAEEKRRIIRFDNYSYYNGDGHVISNIDEVKAAIGYVGMTYEQLCQYEKEYLKKNGEPPYIDW